jgi:hypothetical protein
MKQDIKIGGMINMKNFVVTVIFGFILNLLVIIFYHGISMQNFVKSFQMFILLNFSALFSFLNFFNFKNLFDLIAAMSWLILILFAYYIYKYVSNKHSLYFWLFFISLWLLLGVYNPGFTA